MKIYRFAIDETGSFTINKGDTSFVCGVLISENKNALRDKYKELYVDLEIGEKAPDDDDKLLKNEANSSDEANFHYTKLSKNKKNICKQKILPVAQKIYISKGQPVLYANNQDWWLKATTVVISNFLDSENFEKGDKVEIYIDCRHEKVVGIPELANSQSNNYELFIKYHNLLIERLEKFIKIEKYKKNGISISLEFNSDTNSFFVNVADLVCGFVRESGDTITQEIVECDCSKFMSGDNPKQFIDTDPLASLTIILEEVSNSKFENIKLIDEILKKLRQDNDKFIYVWDIFYDFIKTKIKERSLSSNLTKLKNFVDIFLNEFNKESCLKLIPAYKSLEIMILFVEYYSHIGAIHPPIEKEKILSYITKTDKNYETRLLRRWEKYISYSLRKAQILFNNYDFNSVKSNFENIWENHEKIIINIPNEISESKKDEPTAAIIGTLAQSYAYIGNYDDAIEYFNLSKDYAIKTSSITSSYIFTIHHLQKNLQKAKKAFKNQTTFTPEEYFNKQNFTKTWDLLLYCKLRALDLHINGSTNLKAVDLKALKNYNTGYPFPLIQKWEGIAKWLESSTNKKIVYEYFEDAITKLLEEESAFTIKTLALPIIQCFALVDNQNKYHAEYNNILRDLKNQSKCFSDYVDKKATLLNDIKNDADIWTRATQLPFIYT